ncbi:hypothetical protein ACFPYN_13950 [Paenisporosarcina macmurdoensis]|uniref:Uncharacterized protein n=1 Tax=Paenisporosarcina macmurdoensis TaxID=212659 RepID=A0ABW1L949_9BACL
MTNSRFPEAIAFGFKRNSQTEVKVKLDQDVNLYLFLEDTLDPWTEQRLSN